MCLIYTRAVGNGSSYNYNISCLLDILSSESQLVCLELELAPCTVHHAPCTVHHTNLEV